MLEEHFGDVEISLAHVFEEVSTCRANRYGVSTRQRLILVSSQLRSAAASGAAQGFAVFRSLGGLIVDTSLSSFRNVALGSRLVAIP